MSVELGEVEQVVVRESGEEPILLPRVESLLGVVMGPCLVALGGDLGRLEIEWWSGRRHRQKRVGGKQGEDVPNLVLLDVP